jgi:hypothetical protein
VLGSLIGCDDDLEYLAAFADRAAVSGGAMLLSARSASPASTSYSARC